MANGEITYNITLNDQKFKKGIINVKKNFISLEQRMEKVSNVSKKLLLGFGLLGGLALRQSAQIESLSVSFEVLTGSVKSAKKLVQELVHFTATTPFELEGVTTTAKSLLAVGVSLQNIKEELRVIGDISAVTGGSIKELGLVIAKIKSKGFADTLQLTEQIGGKGIPIIEELIKKYDVSRAELFKKIERREVTYNDISEVFKDLTSSGGQFFQGTFKQSQTLAGLFTTLKDNVKLFGASFGDAFNDDIKESMRSTIKVFESLTKFVSENSGLIKGITLFSVKVLAITAILPRMIKAFKSIRSVMLTIIPLSKAYLGTLRATNLTLATSVGHFKSIKNLIPAIAVFYAGFKAGEYAFNKVFASGNKQIEAMVKNMDVLRDEFHAIKNSISEIDKSIAKNIESMGEYKKAILGLRGGLKELRKNAYENAGETIGAGIQEQRDLVKKLELEKFELQKEGKHELAGLKQDEINGLNKQLQIALDIPQIRKFFEEWQFNQSLDPVQKAIKASTEALEVAAKTEIQYLKDIEINTRLKENLESDNKVLKGDKLTENIKLYANRKEQGLASNIYHNAVNNKVTINIGTLGGVTDIKDIDKLFLKGLGPIAN